MQKSNQPEAKFMPFVQVGGGRLGQLIRQKIESNSSLSHLLVEKNGVAGVLSARIDAKRGLDIATSSSHPTHIATLLICIAPGANKQWSWQNILVGLVRQVKEHRLVINQVLFISSTRVYEGIAKGIVDASSQPAPLTERAKNLLAAESQIKSIGSHSCIFRCCGLVGKDYQRYAEILSQPTNKARFAIDIEQVAERVVNWLSQTNESNQLLILTDGYCYWDGKKLTWQDAQGLVDQQRLLQDSQIFLSDSGD